MSYFDGLTPETPKQRETRLAKGSYIPSLPPIKESFSWLTPDWKATEPTKKTVKIKGKALFSDVVSKNKRKYIDEELKMAARTLHGKPITINHKDHEKVGTVIHAEYEDGAIEFVGHVKKEPYVSLLRDHDATIRGVSVQAAYLHNRCTECGQKFYMRAQEHGN